MSSLDELNEEARAALIRTKLAHLIALARARSPFWAERLSALPSTPALHDLPILTKDEVAANAPPQSEALLTEPLGASGAYVFRSGGTSGDPRFSVFSVEEFRSSIATFQRVYTAAGLRPTDRVGNLFSCGSLYASFVFVNRLLEELGCLNFSFTAAADPDLVVTHLGRFGIDTLVGFPSWLMRVAERVPEELRGQVRKLFYGGEQLTEGDRAYLAERFGVTLIASAGYGAVDTGLMGFQCPHADGGIHHAMLDVAVLEVVDHETLRPMPAGEVGKLLVTCLDRSLMPVLRYDIGDMARWLPEPCPCGRTSPRFELMGRTQDSLRIGIATVAFAEIQHALAPWLAPGNRIQLVKGREDGRDRLVVRLESPRPVERSEALLAAVLAAKPDLAKMVAGGQIHPLEVAIVPPGSLKAMAVTGKVPHTVDESVAHAAR